MAIPTGVRPRSASERLRVAQVLATAPRVVALDFPDDGWTAACLRIAGRVPVWGGFGDARRAEAYLDSLGLPGFSDEQPLGRIDEMLRLHGDSPVGVQTLPLVDGPLVSILICTYNRADMVLEAIASALDQSWPCQIIVVDDGSTDETPHVLAQVEGVEVIRKENGGKPSALAEGMKRVRGEALMILDDDDLLLPGAVFMLARALFEDIDRVVVYGDTVVFEDASMNVLRYLPAMRLPGELARIGVLQQIPAGTGATLVRWAAQQEAGGYDPRLVRGEDMDMFLRLARLGKMEAIPHPTFLCRSHSGLRGDGAQQWTKGNARADFERFAKVAAPVFVERWKDCAPMACRMEGHAWALGLWRRGLEAEAREEAGRWKGPHTLSESWAREQMGLASTPSSFAEALVVVDEGDEGALEETLSLHAQGREIFVDLEVPRDPLGNIRLYWQGRYGAQERLHSWVDHTGPIHLRTTADPGWAPPAIENLGLLPDLPAPDALMAVAAVMGWEAPGSSRRGISHVLDPLAEISWRVRLLVEGGYPEAALEPLEQVRSLAPGWPGSWKLAALVYGAVGDQERARYERERLDRWRESKSVA
jgi:hypothetical protein